MNVAVFNIVSWPMFIIALLVFGFAPGAMLRLIVLAFRKDDPRRSELLAELHAVPRIERPFWVFEQLEVALFEGLHGRFAAWRKQKKAQIDMRILTIRVGDMTHLSNASGSSILVRLDRQVVRLANGNTFVYPADRKIEWSFDILNLSARKLSPIVAGLPGG